MKHQPDWAAIDALTDEDIARQIAANPDAAPDMGGVPLERWTSGQLVEPFDYRDLLRRYIEHVGECEAMDYLDEQHANMTKWAAGELAELRRLAGRDPETGRAT